MTLETEEFLVIIKADSSSPRRFHLMMCLKALAEDIWKSYETERFQFENRGETLGMEPQSLCLLGWETKYPSHPTVATPPCTPLESSSPPILVLSGSILVSLSSRCAHSLTRGTPQCQSATKLDFLNQKRSLTAKISLLDI